MELPFSEAIDMWALGCVMFAMVYGNALLEGNCFYEIVSHPLQSDKLSVTCISSLVVFIQLVRQFTSHMYDEKSKAGNRIFFFKENREWKRVLGFFFQTDENALNLL